MVKGISLKPATDKELKRFAGKYRVDVETGCWLWTATRNQMGYGVFIREAEPGARGRVYRCLAHRFSYRAYRGEIPPDLLVCHRCDTPACVNPHHFFLGTEGDNTADMTAKGRRVPCPGEANGRAKLTERDIIFVLQSPLKNTQLGPMLGVDQSTIYKIRRGRRWQYLREIGGR